MILKRIHHSYILTRILVTIGLLMFYGTSSYSQKMSVESFQLDETDLTAIQHGTIVLDQNGEKCALIKIETTHKGFSFDTGSLGIAKVEEQCSLHPGEIWLYVPHGCKKLTIQHGMFGTIKNYDLRVSVKKGKTYVMKLTTDHVTTTVLDYTHRQYLILDVYPENADVYINGFPVQLNEQGILETEMPFGTHNYRITAKNYHPAEGQVVINDEKNKHKLSVVLKQAFGYLSLKSPSKDFDGAEVYVDSVRMGNTPLQNIPVGSGVHTLYVTKKLYKPFVKEFSVTDSAFVNIIPTFEPNYAEVTISADDDDEIQLFDNAELLGNGKWQGRLDAGEHYIEARKKGHRPTRKHVTIVAGIKSEIVMDCPTPIYGSIQISSIPTGADVYIDNKRCGVTPYVNDKIIIGEHRIELRKSSHRSEAESIVVYEGQTHKITKSLTDYCNAMLDANVKAYVYVNDEYMGMTPYRFNVVGGKYKVKLSANRYSTYSRKMKLDANTKDMHVKLHRNYVRKNEFYFNFGITPVGVKSWHAGMGFYIYNFNMEGNYIGNMFKSEEIYLISGDDTYPRVARYSPWGYNVRTGWGIRCGSRFRITPQIGFQWISLKESDPKNDDYIGYADGANSYSLMAGARVSFAILSWLGISATPEYLLPVCKSGGYKVLSDVSKDIKGYCHGFNCNVNLNIFF